METHLPAILFGLMIVIFGITLLMLTSPRASKERELDESLPSSEQQFLKRQSRRRTKIALLLIVIGVGIPIVDFLAELRGTPWLSLTALLGLLLTILWVLLLAFQDLRSVRHVRSKINEKVKALRKKQYELEEEAKQLKSQSQFEGQAPTPSSSNGVPRNNGSHE